MIYCGYKNLVGKRKSSHQFVIILFYRTQLHRVRHAYDRDLNEVKDAISRHKCHQCGQVKAAKSTETTDNQLSGQAMVSI